MRLVYLVRSAQLLLTLHAIFLLYSVDNFCQKEALSLQQCLSQTITYRNATPEEIAALIRRNELQDEAERAAKNTSDASTTVPTTTAHAPSTTESSTVTPSTTEGTKKRVKRSVAKELPGNGVSEGQRKAGVAVVETKKEEGKKEGEQKSSTTVKAEVKTEVKVDEKKEEKKEAVTSPVPVHHEEKKEEQKSEHPEPKTEEKKEDKKEEKKDQHEDEKKPEHSTDERTKEEKTEVKKEEVSTTTETPVTTTASESKEKKKDSLGAKVDIPVAVEAHHNDTKPAEGKVLSSSTSSGEKPHVVKKDLKVHVQEPVTIEEKTKENPTTLAPEHEQYADKKITAFLEETRCLEITWGVYFGMQASPFAAHLMGLVIVGPVLIIVAVYLVCTVLRTIHSKELPTEFAHTFGCLLYGALWMVVQLSMLYIYKNWTKNWIITSNETFKPAFPCQWNALILLASFMMITTALELFFKKRLNFDIVFERAYRCYEVIDTTELPQNQGRSSRTNVY